MQLTNNIKLMKLTSGAFRNLFLKKIKKLGIKIIIIFIFINYNTLQSQVVINDPLNIKSPSVTDFIRYGNIGASLNTGTINLDIPLIEVNVKNQKPLAINLGYNSAGFIPSKRPGIVGLNWFLNVGGVITRQVKGVPDDHDGDPATNGAFCDPNGFIVGVRKKIYNSTDVFNFNAATGYKHLQQQWLLGSGDVANVDDAYEGSPDIFSFNFNGISGTFFMGNDGLVKVITNEPNNLIIDLSGFKKQTKNTRSICYPVETSEIKITDNQGNQYIFGGEINNLEYSMLIGTQGVTPSRNSLLTPTITSWFLREIIYSNNSHIKFLYRNTSGNLGSLCESRDISVNNPFFTLNGYVSEMSENTRKKSLDLSHGVMISNSSSSFSNPKLSYELNKKTILDRIEGDDFVINLSYSTQSYFFNIAPGWFADYENKDLKLDNLTLVNKKNEIVKSVQFDYQYQGGTNSRMFLKKITELGKTPYIFDYNVTSGFPTPTTRGVDYWGFWNGKDSQSSMIPGINYLESGDFTYTTDAREPDINYSKQGILSKVTYPTGGYSIFEYEPHRYSRRLESLSTNAFLPMLNTVSGIAGGTRIRKIYDFDGISNTNIKEYDYVNNYSPTNSANVNYSGILLQWPRYAKVLEASNNLGEYYRTASFSSISVNSPIAENSIINYAEVTEKTISNGYIVSKFSNFITNPDINNINFRYNDQAAPLTPIGLYKVMQGDYYNDAGIERGKISSKEIFNSSASLVSSEIYKYNESPSRFNYFSTSTNNDKIYAKANKIYYYNNYLTQKVSKLYDNTNFIATTENYNYNPVTSNLISKSEVNSVGETIETKYSYPSDASMSSEPNINIFALKNITGIPIDIQTIRGTDKIFEQKIQYGYDNTTGNLLLPQNIYSNVGSAGIDLIVDKKITYDLYDQTGNILQYTTEKGIPVTIVWGYNNTLPIAKIENAAYSNINSSLINAAVSKSNTDTEANLITALNAIRNSLPLGMVTSYTYVPLVGISTITDPKGVINYYKYDDSKRLWLVRDQNLNVLQRYCYNYKGQQTDCTKTIYFSAVKSGSYTRNCSAGTALPIIYTVAAGTYTSIISQADADAKAQADVVSNGQNYADKNSDCVFKNVLKSAVFTKVCTGGLTGSNVTYTVPAGTYTSIISQADADAKAQNDITINGQNYANTNGTCTQVTPVYTSDYEFYIDDESIQIWVYCSTSVHPTVTFNLNIIYKNRQGTERTISKTIVLTSGQVSNTSTFALQASSVSNVQVVSVTQ